MLDPPPSTLPIDNKMDRPFSAGLGSAWNPSLAPAQVERPLHRSSDFGCVVGAACLQQQHTDVRVLRDPRATTEPDEPDPQTMKSYCRAMLAGCMCFSIRFGFPRVSRLATAGARASLQAMATPKPLMSTTELFYGGGHHTVVRRGLASLAHIGTCIDDLANQAGIERKCEAQWVCWK